MKRLKSTLASVLLMSAALAALGLGTVLAIAAMVIGLVMAGAARLAISAQDRRANADEAENLTPAAPAM